MILLIYKLIYAYGCCLSLLLEAEMGNDIWDTDLSCPDLYLVFVRHRWVEKSTKGRTRGVLKYQGTQLGDAGSIITSMV